MEERRRRKIDFVPEENEWHPDEREELWSGEEEDLERTVVLKPIQEEQAYPEEYGGGYDGEYPEEEGYPDYGEETEAYGEDYDGEWAEEDDEEAPKRRHSGQRLREKVSASLKPDPHKYGRDPYENLEEEPEVWPDRRQLREDRYAPGTGWRGNEKIQRAGKASGAGQERGPRSAKGGRTWWRRPILFRLLSLACMLVLLAALGRGFWADREALGPVLSAFEDGNYGALLYLLLAAGTIAYGVVSLLWMLSRRRVYWDGRLRRMDVGRGLTSFLLFALLVFLSARAALRLPEDSWFFSGLRRYMLAAASAQGPVYVCSALGVLSCILRKLMK